MALGPAFGALLFPRLIEVSLEAAPVTMFLIAFAIVAVRVAEFFFVTRRKDSQETGEPSEDFPDGTPLEQARAAVEALPPEDREQFRRWLEWRWPPAHTEDHSEGIKS
jgi:hypothetical protein